MATPMTPSEYSMLYSLLDDYSRAKHRCFVAELTFIKARAEYAVCFRPIGGTKDSPNRYASCYLGFAVDKLMEAYESKKLPVSITELLDRELPNLGRKGGSAQLAG